MKALASLTGLNIDSPFVTCTALNFRPSSWPPPPDFPIVVDGNGKVICRYSDPVWRLWPWAKKAFTLNFGDGPLRSGTRAISTANANLLRQTAAWWLYGPKAVRKPAHLKSRFTMLRGLFVLCSQEGIVASDITRFPRVADRIPAILPRSSGSECLYLLHGLYEHREELGFTLLDREGLARLESALPEHESRQTPYIPPRIWLYQVNRLRQFLDDFLKHRQGIEDCFRFSLEAYANNAGSLAEACLHQTPADRRPFQPPYRSRTHPYLRFYGPFSETARRFGIDILLQRWLLRPGDSLDGRGHGIRLLSAYFSMVGYVGAAYLMNFSLMRIEEAWALRTDCLQIEQDERFGPIYLLKGPTTKTIEDDGALWVTSPSVKIAISAMSCVARLRMVFAEANPEVTTNDDDLSRPHLTLRCFEPWSNTKAADTLLATRPAPLDYRSVCRVYHRLFEPDEMRITKEDLRVARLVTPSLDSEEFAVGKIWPLAWHQLRRTGAVNMQASGLVSDASIQYQLKHASRAMALYYGRGYSCVRLNEKARNEYIRTMYEVIGKQIRLLFSERFVSPYGDERKADILKLVDPKDVNKLTAAARAGKVSWRETLLGVCTRIGPCEYGGIDNIVRCGGGDGRGPCPEALYDREKAPAIRQLRRDIAIQLIDAPANSPDRASLMAQDRSAETALNEIE